MTASSQGPQNCLWASIRPVFCHWPALLSSTEASLSCGGLASPQPSPHQQPSLLCAHGKTQAMVVNADSQGSHSCQYVYSWLWCLLPAQNRTTTCVLATIPSHYTETCSLLPKPSVCTPQQWPKPMSHNTLSHPGPGATTCPHIWCPAPLELGSHHAPAWPYLQVKVFPYQFSP